MVKEINNKVKNINTLKTQIYIFSNIVNLEKDKLKQELKDFKLGRSNSDILIRYEEDLLKARLNLAQSFYNYRTSLLDLKLYQSTLLDQYWESDL